MGLGLELGLGSGLELRTGSGLGPGSLRTHFCSKGKCAGGVRVQGQGRGQGVTALGACRRVTWPAPRCAWSGSASSTCDCSSWEAGMVTWPKRQLPLMSP